MPTTIIILLVVALNIYIARFSSRKEIIGKILAELWYNRLGLTLLLALYYVFWHVGQGQDLLVNVNTEDSRVIWMFFSISIFAILTWYLPRLIYPQNIDTLRNARKNQKASNKESDVKSRGIVDNTPPKKKSMPLNMLTDIYFPEGNFVFNNHYKEQIQTQQEQAKNMLPDLDLYVKTRSIENIPKLPKQDKEAKENEAVLKVKNKIPEQITRFMGAVAIFILAGAVLKVYLTNSKQGMMMSDSQLAHTYLISMIVLSVLFVNLNETILFGWLVRKNIIHSKLSKQMSCWGVIIIGLSIIGLLGILNNNDINSMLLLVWSLTVLGFLFLFIITVRRKNYFIIDFELWIRKRIFRTNNWIVARNGGMLFLFITLTCLVITTYIVFANLFFLDWAQDKAIPVILFSLGFYYIIFTAIEFFSKYKQVPFLFVGIFIFTLINISNNGHNDVRISNTEDNKIYSQTEKRNTFADYFKGWADARKSEIADTTATYPVYIVAAEGGGSRAGFWTSYVLSKLQDDSNGEFSKHIFGMTGASGGQVGMTMFNSVLKADMDRDLPIENYGSIPKKVYKNDFLSTSLLMLLGRDFWQSFNIAYEKVFTWSDRAEKVETEWSRALCNEISPANGVEDLEQPFLSFWYDKDFKVDKSYQIPLLFMNSNWIEKGSRGISSPVILGDEFINTLDILDNIAKYKEGTIRKNTAALLGARFPYVSPSGRIQNGYHFNDAGYYDNTGGITALEIYEQCKKLQEEDTTGLMANLDFRFIVIRNDNYQESLNEDNPTNISELTVPLNTILQGRNATTSYFYESMKAAAGENNFHSIDVIHGGEIIIPVSRYLTEVAIDAMIKSYEQPNTNSPVIQNILQQVKKLE